MSDPTDTAPVPRRGGPGRKPRLLIDPKLQAEIVGAVANGTPVRHAAAAAGVNETLLYQWINLGTDDPGTPATEDSPGRPPRKARSPYREFAEALQKAKPKAIRNYVSTIASAARGATITTTTTHPDGRVEVRTEQQPGEWRAAAFMLPRLAPDDFAEKRILAHAGPTGAGPVLIGGPAEMVAAMREMTPEQLRAIASGAVAAGWATTFSAMASDAVHAGDGAFRKCRARPPMQPRSKM